MKQDAREREVLERDPTAPAEGRPPAPAPTPGTQARTAAAAGPSPARRASFLELISKPAE